MSAHIYKDDDFGREGNGKKSGGVKAEDVVDSELLEEE